MKKRRTAYRTPRRHGADETSSRQPRQPFVPRINRQLRPVLEQIGVPEPEPFVPDSFQIEAINKLEDHDVIVSAPTGSGKTYIAVKAMEKVILNGGRAWYASPLKALSNSKYLEFGTYFGQDRIGLLTGDHKVNTDAQLIVGTTEILRNQLYDAMRRGENLAADLIVMDEAHYLGDPERGVVWEEILIYLSPRVRLLLLSATIENAREIADWLSTIRGQDTAAVITRDRPVPLFPLFLFPDGELAPLSKGGRLTPQIRHFVQNNPPRGTRAGKVQTPYGRIIRALGETSLLPAIFFLKSRADCDTALSRCYGAVEFSSEETMAKREKRLDELLDQYPFLKSHPQIKYLRGPGVASHHAGQMPHWKILIEHLMQEGLLNAIFSTSTVAAGVNFPARTVVITQSDRFNGREFANLTTTELLQMTGRAGRRGMDRIGFALVIPGPFQDVFLVNSLFGASPEPVLSQIHINFSMVLNLLLSHEPGQIKDLLDRSLAAFQQGKSRKALRINEIREELDSLLEGACGGADEAFSLFEKSEYLKNELRQLQRLRPRLAWEIALQISLTPGRLFEITSGQMFCAFELAERRGVPGVMAARIKDDLGLRKGRVRQKWVPLEKIGALFQTDLAIDPDSDPRELLYLIRAAARLHHDVADPLALVEGRNDDRLTAVDARITAIEGELDSLPCRACPFIGQCHGTSDSEASYLLKKLKRMESDQDNSGRILWASCVRHLEFLKEEGFVTPEGQLTDDGLWASQLRLDHPLVIGAGVRQKAWPEDSPELLAAVVAPFVMDREIESDISGANLPPELAAAWLKIEKSVSPMIASLASAGFPVPQLSLKPAQAIYHWTRFGQWEEAVNLYGQDPGDMAMLVFRTADNLRQLANLEESHPHLGPTARAAVSLILREPVVVPL